MGRKQLCSFDFATLHSGGLSLKEGLAALESILFFIIEDLFERLDHPGKQTGSHKWYFAL